MVTYRLRVVNWFGEERPEARVVLIQENLSLVEPTIWEEIPEDGPHPG